MRPRLCTRQYTHRGTLSTHSGSALHVRFGNALDAKPSKSCGHAHRIRFASQTGIARTSAAAVLAAWHIPTRIRALYPRAPVPGEATHT